MKRISALLTAITLVVSFLVSISSAWAAVCGDLGKRGDYRAQLRALNCLTAVASADASERPAMMAKIERGFRELYLDLSTRPLLDDEGAAWVELYRLSARFYPKKEVLSGDVPITFVNAHHYSLPHWIERSLKTPVGTLIHFDTHSDMEGVPRPDDVRAAVADLKANRNPERAWHTIAHAAHRNAMPVTGAVLAAGVTDVVWAKPGWATDPVDFVQRKFFYARPNGYADPRALADLEKLGPDMVNAAYKGQASDFFLLHYDPGDNDNRWLPRREREVETWQLAGPLQRPHASHFEGIADIRFSIVTTDRPDSDLGKLASAVSTDKFVLDIDLDYFVNAGAGGDTETTDDPPSYGERAVQRREEAESALSIFNHKRYRAAAAATERAVIERRIRRFREVLLALKKAGKAPSIVSIADSANLPFTTALEGQEHSDFVPVHHAYWVRERVTSAIKEVYGDGKASGLAAGPRASELPAPARRKDEPVIGTDHKAFEQVRSTVRDALYAALAWATGAATTYAKAPHLSAYLSIIHAIARHGPDAGLRAAAKAAGEVHARLTLDPTSLVPSMTPTKSDVEESLRRIAFGMRYGATEAEVARGGVSWFAKATGLKQEPDLDADTLPLSPSAALTMLGLERVFKSGQEPNLCDVFLGSQATDGGFTIAEMPAITRAVYSLAAVRGILGLLPTAELKKQDDKPAFEGAPYSQGDVDAALLRGVMFTLSVLGELPGTEPAIDGLLLLRSATLVRGNEAVSQQAAVAGRLLAGRIAVKVPQLLSGINEPEQIVAFAELGLALQHFAHDVGDMRRELVARRTQYPTEAILGLKEKDGGKLTFADAFRLVARSAVLTTFGLPGFSYDEALRRVLPLTATATFTTQGDELVDRFNAIVHLVLSASGFRQVKLDRERFPGEWKFLEETFTEVVSSRRLDLVSAMLEIRHTLGEDPASPRVRDLTWQLLHEQNKDGSWGRRAPDDQRLRMTWAALAALGDLQGSGRDNLVRIATEQVGVRRLAARLLEGPAQDGGTPTSSAPTSSPPAVRPGSVLRLRVKTSVPAGRHGDTPRVTGR